MSSSTDINIIRYIAHDGHHYLKIHYLKALAEGPEFKLKDVLYTIAPVDELKYYMHKHAPRLNVKIEISHVWTIAKIYAIDPALLYDIIKLKGGSAFLGELLIKLDELYKQEQTIKSWEENLM